MQTRKILVRDSTLIVALIASVFTAGCTSPRDTHQSDTATAGSGYGLAVSLSAGNLQIAEGATQASFSLALSAPAANRIDISFVTMNGTAASGKDFEARKGVVSFAPGQTQRNIDIPIIDDALDEDSEDFHLKLVANASVSVTTPLVTAVILDNDDPPELSVSDADMAEGNAGARKLLFQIQLDAPSGKQVTVEFATADASATTPQDFTHASGQVSFAPGETTRLATVVVFGDTVDEGDEHLMLGLQNADNATLIAGTAMGTILNDDPSSGLESRPTNLSCVAPPKPTVNTSIDHIQVFAGAGAFTQPVALLLAPDDPSQWYVVEKGGSVYRFANDPGVNTRNLFIDISDRVHSDFVESGLLGMAFHPDYATNHFVYLSYTATGPTDQYQLTSRLSRFETLDGGLTLDPDSEVILLSQDQRNRNHNGGHIAFGPDGFLYFGFGDSGGAGDPGNRAQNTKNLFGAVIRIDVDTGTPYGIPPDNPFAENPLCDISTTGVDSPSNCPEIYAWGFRNPWRWSIDEVTGLFWLADVGQETYEEVNHVELGGNYGWRIQEALTCFNPPTNCDKTNLIQPIIVYDHSLGESVTGGLVYRGAEIPELIGRYVFGDYVTGVILASTSPGDGSFGYEELADTSFFISHFAEDELGELYFLDYVSGSVRRIVQFNGTANNTIPTLLSETGCTDPADITKPAAGLISYDTNVSFWSDGADKARYMALPQGTTVDVDAAGDWLFPVGTVLVKNFRLSGQLIETRHMMRHTNGEWAGYTYEWNEDQTEATRVIGGKTKDIDGQTWIYPSETECMMCHTSIANFAMGPEHAQLNMDYRYPETGQTANQLYTADLIDILTDPLPDAAHNLPSLAGPSAPAEDQVRAYLHVNCAGCHRPGGPTTSNMDLRYDTAWPDMNVCDVIPTINSFGIADARLIAPGDASRSIIVTRISRRDVHGMPPVGSELVDTAGVDLLTTWIDALSACPL